MRKVQKKLILDLIQTLYEAHDAIKKYINKKDFANAQALLGECQNAALQITNTIEQSEDKGVVTANLIKDYSIALYRICEKIDVSASGNNICKTLNKLLTRVNKSVKRDIKVRLEMVFLPYKASMFDSLESVWKAANDDPDCDAYVIPIPYYDRNPDHSFGEFHYEGMEYPDYVPVVHYDDYNLEQRRPDAVFIHNPYDECNYVTSVDPRFYSKELKKYTDMLVYIPYYVTLGDVPKHFCTLAGCVYAHKVIVQSERVRNTFIRVFNGEYKDTLENSKNKFVALGSPKIDKVTNAQYNGSKLPEKWRAISQGKKLVLYNISIGSMLQDPEQYFLKLSDVLNIFRNREDVTLWWRPHPLLESTLSGMLPKFKKLYKEITEKYRKDNYGIYDDTPDLYRAFKWCDVYYGDGSSSLMAMWMATGKPFLLQNMKMLSNCFNTSDSPSPDTFCFSLPRGMIIWEKHQEHSRDLRINLINFLNALSANELYQLPYQSITWLNDHYAALEKGSGNAIYEYIKQQVMST